MQSENIGPQTVDATHLKHGKRGVKKLKARHISFITQRETVRMFEALQSFDDVADRMKIPGFTGKTVAEIVALHQLRIPPASEMRLSVVSGRRAA